MWRSNHLKRIHVRSLDGRSPPIGAHDPWSHGSARVGSAARIDHLLDDYAFDITHENVEHLVAEVRTLTRPSIEGDGFERAYYEALHRAPDVVLAHFQVKRVLLAEAA